MSEREIRWAVLDLLDESPPAPSLDLPSHAPAKRLPVNPLAAVAAVAVGVLLLVGIPVWWLFAGSASAPGAPKVGSEWVEASDAPFGPRMSTCTTGLADGRILVWGGLDNTPDGAFHRVLTDGGIYDPVTNRWEPIFEAPAVLDDEFSAIQVVQNWLLVLATAGADRDDLVGAMYDIETGTWAAIPVVPGISRYADAVGWNGETLAVVRVDPGEGDWAVLEPVTMVWSLESGIWSEGAAPPLSTRFGAGAAFDSARIVLWGGTTFNPHVVDPDVVSSPLVEPGELGFPERSETGVDLQQLLEQDAVRDGAIYNLATDEWRMMADAPLFVVGGSVVWIEDQIVVGSRSLVDSPSTAATYDPSSDQWSTFSLGPSGFAPGEQRPSRWFYSDGTEPLATVGSLVAHSGPQPTEWYDHETSSWFGAPTYDLHRSGNLVVATTASYDNPNEVAFVVNVFSDGKWTQLDSAPFTNRMNPGVALVGNFLIVSAGAEGRNLDLTADTWVLELD